jgi:hypothetical protein
MLSRTKSRMNYATRMVVVREGGLLCMQIKVFHLEKLEEKL